MMEDLIEEKLMSNHFVELASSKLTENDPEIMKTLEEAKYLNPEFNEARVQYFKRKIKSGDYEIDSATIARKLLNLEPA